MVAAGRAGAQGRERRWRLGDRSTEMQDFGSKRRVYRAYTVILEVCGGDAVLGDKPIVSFVRHTSFGCGHFKLEKSNDVVSHKLCCDRTADKVRELCSAESKILLNLHYAERIRSPLCLHRDNILRSTTIYPDVYFIGLDRSDVWNCGPKMTLELIASQACENVN